LHPAAYQPFRLPDHITGAPALNRQRFSPFVNGDALFAAKTTPNMIKQKLCILPIGYGANLKRGVLRRQGFPCASCDELLVSRFLLFA
jgi:hypothetical protein